MLKSSAPGVVGRLMWVCVGQGVRAQAVLATETVLVLHQGTADTFAVPPDILARPFTDRLCLFQLSALIRLKWKS